MFLAFDDDDGIKIWNTSLSGVRHEQALYSDVPGIQVWVHRKRQKKKIQEVYSPQWSATRASAEVDYRNEVS